jgi:RNA polymerase sigma-70 factor (ECF subfamily)
MVRLQPHSPLDRQWGPWFAGVVQVRGFGLGKGVDLNGASGRSQAADLRKRALWIARHVLPHEADLRRTLQRRAPGGLEVDDIVQEIYARLASMATVAHIQSPRGYVFRMAAGLMADFVRHQKVVPIHNVGDVDRAGRASEEASPETIVSDREDLRRLLRIVDALPPAVADVFRLRRFEGLSQKEVARRLHVPESTVEKRIARGLYLVAQAFETGGNGTIETTRSLSRKLQRDHKAREP